MASTQHTAVDEAVNALSFNVEPLISFWAETFPILQTNPVSTRCAGRRVTSGTALTAQYLARFTLSFRVDFLALSLTHTQPFLDYQSSSHV